MRAGVSSRSNGCGRCWRNACSRMCARIRRSGPSCQHSRPQWPRAACPRRLRSRRLPRRSAYDRYNLPMSLSILITGFGPFPGAPFNPTGVLAEELARRRHPAFANVRRIAHVFRVSYEAVDRDLPALIAREKPQAFVMFGLAGRTKHVRIETLARNVLTRFVPDADGQIPAAATIVSGAPVALSLRVPTHRLLIAAPRAPLLVAP